MKHNSRTCFGIFHACHFSEHPQLHAWKTLKKFQGLTHFNHTREYTRRLFRAKRLKCRDYRLREILVWMSSKPKDFPAKLGFIKAPSCEGAFLYCQFIVILKQTISTAVFPSLPLIVRMGTPYAMGAFSIPNSTQVISKRACNTIKNRIICV